MRRGQPQTADGNTALRRDAIDGQSGNANKRRTRHVNFGLEVIQEYSCGAGWPCETSVPLVREFLHGDPARYPEQVAMIRHNPDTQDQWTYHYLHDVLGSVIGVVDEDGDLVERFTLDAGERLCRSPRAGRTRSIRRRVKGTTYDPYGKVFIEKWDDAANEGSGARVERASECGTGVPACGQMPYSSIGNPFLWTGHRYDAAVGLYHTLFRTYSPTLGRWLQRDPIEYEAGSVNLYEYAVSSPLASIDPLGLETRVAKGNCSAPPSDEYQQDKCRAAANKALSNCLESEKAGGAGAPTKDNCFKSFTQSMDACARGKPGTHDKEVVAGWDYFDCVGNCIDNKYGEIIAAAGVVLLPGATIPKEGTIARHIAGRTSGLGGIGGGTGAASGVGTGTSAYTNVGSAVSTRLRLGATNPLRSFATKVGPLFWIDAATAAGIEAYCATTCLTGVQSSNP